ncbi:MAG: 3-hydroxybutyryl-CoA dehydrogenase [Deltaproteobacteria bacterium]|jgi:3-hydroxybutyryl-CoA dehydrogenase|nr:3-hydroxybutyryl-CoA dehydrogenase [Deltaproteobacteria bacterium]MBK8694660.1 3-hydroxybutyryl-CoA dehydrogenase [Deltaproteobacteria bacterium]MBP6832920.1 3-hydroxybutyryl-CoA dehydrogenase [Deltaproteobacteria bacterium]
MSDIAIFGVLGAGQMGSGIAQVAAGAGWTVKLADASLDRATAARDKIASGLRKLVEKGKVGADEAGALVGRIVPVGSIEELGDADLVVEAVTEHLDTKLALFEKLDAAVKPGAVLASNTSSISLTRIAAATRRPADVVGLHFFNPVPMMRLVEIVRALQTSDETYQRALTAVAGLNKTAVTAKDSPGFLVNRMLLPLLLEAVFVLENGLGTPHDIDHAAKLGLNHPMGPLELSDFIGLDTVLAIADVLQREFGDDKYRAPVLLRNYVAAGWLGRKTGRGFYSYEKK